MPGASLCSRDEAPQPRWSEAGPGMLAFPGVGSMAPSWHPPPELPAARKGFYLLLPTCSTFSEPQPWGDTPSSPPPSPLRSGYFKREFVSEIVFIEKLEWLHFNSGEPHLTH